MTTLATPEQPARSRRIRAGSAEGDRDRNELRTLKRGLKALAFLNQTGPTNLATLARHLEVPRPNAYRILQTLIAEGYCERVPNSRLYMVAPPVRRLACGLGEGEILTSVAVPIVEALAAKVKWPLALATPVGGEMLVRLSTDKETPLALAKIGPGARTPLLLTTTGLLFIGFSDESKRESLIQGALVGRAIRQFFHDYDQLQLLIREAREQGYLILDTKFVEASLGVPLISRGKPLGGLVMRYIKSAAPRARVIATHLPMLLAAAAEIIEAYEAAAGDPLADSTADSATRNTP